MANDPQIRHTCETVKEALEIDVEMGTDSWQKEMAEVKVAWKSTDEVTPEQARTGKEPSLIGFQGIRCQAIFDVKMDFTRKARFVAGGHMTDTPGLITYSSVVSRDSVRLAFLIAGLNDLNVLAGDVTNAYLNTSCRDFNCKARFVAVGHTTDSTGSHHIFECRVARQCATGIPNCRIK